jgi:hypothetical protein
MLKNCAGCIKIGPHRIGGASHFTETERARFLDLVEREIRIKEELLQIIERGVGMVGDLVPVLALAVQEALKQDPSGVADSFKRGFGEGQEARAAVDELFGSVFEGGKPCR